MQVKRVGWKPGGGGAPFTPQEATKLPLATCQGSGGWLCCVCVFVQVRIWPPISPKMSGPLAVAFSQMPIWKMHMR